MQGKLLTFRESRAMERFVSKRGPRATTLTHHCCLLLLLLFLVHKTLSLQVQSTTTTPPLIDVPTYSLATLGANDNDIKTTNMNIVTYASPVSIQPDRLWCVGLVKNSLSHANFVKHKYAILQLLSPKHDVVVKLLGGSSGRDVNKRLACQELGFEWTSLEDTEAKLPLVLPNCAHYLLLKCIESVDGGSHDVCVCKVEKMWQPNALKSDDDDDADSSYLSTRRLRQLGIITKQGRVADEDSS